jgi:hypothetical protein
MQLPVNGLSCNICQSQRLTDISWITPKCQVAAWRSKQVNVGNQPGANSFAVLALISSSFGKARSTVLHADVHIRSSWQL